jgi:hypothetical protein
MDKLSKIKNERTQLWRSFTQTYSESEVKLHDQPLTDKVSTTFKVLEGKVECLYALDVLRSNKFQFSP